VYRRAKAVHSGHCRRTSRVADPGYACVDAAPCHDRRESHFQTPRRPARGCSIVQAWLVSRPLPAADVEAFVRERDGLPAPRFGGTGVPT
jgi:hypothetical protein